LLRAALANSDTIIIMNIAFFGASYVAGSGLDDRSARFSTVVASTLDSNETNLGLDGSLVIGRDDNGMLISDTSGIARTPDAIDSAADKLIILYGEDDWKNSGEPGGSEHFRQGTFLWDYDTIVRGLIDAHEPEQIVLVTVPAADYSTVNAASLPIDAYNKHIRSTAAKYSLTLIDPATETPELLSPDDFDAEGNLNPSGHLKLAKLIAERLAS
jgi:hypothetical protein